MLIKKLLPPQPRKDFPMVKEVLGEVIEPGQIFSTSLAKAVTKNIWLKCGWEFDPRNPISISLLDFVSEKMDSNSINYIALKLACGKSWFKRGYSFADKLPKEKTSFVCIGAKDGSKPEFKFLITEGPDSGEQIGVSINYKYFNWLARKGGFKGRNDPYEQQPSVIFGGQFSGTLLRGNKLRLVKLHATDKQVGRNRYLRQKRASENCSVRKKGNSKLSCGLCPIPFRECNLSTHFDKWKFRGCDKHNFWEDSEGCIACRLSDLLLNTKFNLK